MQRILIVFFLTTLSAMLWAQPRAGMQWILDPASINPARSGALYHRVDQSMTGSEVNASVGAYWANGQSANTMVRAGVHHGFGNVSHTDGPGPARMGVGLQAFNDRAHLLGRSGLSVSYAYSVYSKDLNHRISFGMNASYVNQNVRLGNATIRDLDDALLMQNDWSGNFFNLGVGLTYRVDGPEGKNNFVVDLVSTNVLNARFSQEADGIIQSRNFLYDQTGGIAPGYHMQAAYSIVVASNEGGKGQRPNNEKGGYTEFRRTLEMDESYTVQELDSLYALQQTTPVVSTDDSSEAIKQQEERQSFQYRMIPSVNMLYEPQSPIQISIILGNAISFPRPNVRLLFGFGTQLQSGLSNATSSGMAISFHSYGGVALFDRFRLLLNVDNNVNTFMRHNDVYGMMVNGSVLF